MAYTPNANRQVRGGKAMVSAKELADFKEQYGDDKTLTDLLNKDKDLQRKIPSSTMKSVRDSIDKEQGASRARDLNAPIRGAKLSANETDPNVADKVRNIQNTFRLNSPENKDEMSDMTFKKGGKVSSASARADGCAQRGKTKGRII